jgi:hypothetical protein
MNLDSILEIAIGLVVTWLILSMATMQIQEVITSLLGTRSKFLEQKLLEMFKDEKLKDQFYNHPIIQALKVKKWRGEEGDKYTQRCICQSGGGYFPERRENRRRNPRRNHEPVRHAKEHDRKHGETQGNESIHSANSQVSCPKP